MDIESGQNGQNRHASGTEPASGRRGFLQLGSLGVIGAVTLRPGTAWASSTLCTAPVPDLYRDTGGTGALVIEDPANPGNFIQFPGGGAPSGATVQVANAESISGSAAGNSIKNIEGWSGTPPTIDPELAQYQYLTSLSPTDAGYSCVDSVLV